MVADPENPVEPAGRHPPARRRADGLADHRADGLADRLAAGAAMGYRGPGEADTMTTAVTTGIGLTRLQHLVLWVSDVQRSVRFYRDVLGFEVTLDSPRAVFLKIPGSADDHHLGLFEQTGVPRPDEGVARMYHSAWEVREITDLVRARRLLLEARALVGASNHGVRQGSGWARVRDLLDGARRSPGGDPGAGPRRRAGPARDRPGVARRAAAAERRLPARLHGSTPMPRRPRRGAPSRPLTRATPGGAVSRRSRPRRTTPGPGTPRRGSRPPGASRPRPHPSPPAG